MRVKRRINHTGRKRIDRADVAILTNEDPHGPPTFDAELDLEKYALPNDAAVYVEAYYKSSTQRFSFGTIGKIVKPKHRTLDKIDHGGRILFRIKVVDLANAGRLLAAAEKVPPRTEDEESKDYLVSVLQKELGDEVWRMDLSTDNKPVLILNNKIPDAIGQVKTNPFFQSLILPAVIREILTFIYWDEEAQFDDTSWQSRWLSYCETLTGSDAPSEPYVEDIRAWMDDVVESFSGQFKLQPRLTEQLLGELR